MECGPPEDAEPLIERWCLRRRCWQTPPPRWEGRGYTLTAQTWRQRAPQSNLFATIRTRPESLVTSDRSLACSDHGENQRQKNHNCAPAHHKASVLLHSVVFGWSGRGEDWTYNSSTFIDFLLLAYISFWYIFVAYVFCCTFRWNTLLTLRHQ